MKIHQDSNDILEHNVLVKSIRQLSSPIEPKPTGVSERLAPLVGIHAVLFDVYGTLFMSASGDIGTARVMGSQQALSEALRFVRSAGVR